MVKRYEVSDAQWERIADLLLPGKAGDPWQVCGQSPRKPLLLFAYDGI